MGDFAFCRDSAQVESYIRRLHGHIYLVRGNHDKHAVVRARGFAWIGGEDQGRSVEVEGQRIFLAHMSHRVWDRSHRGAWHLYGHSHGSLPDDPNSLSLDVGVDAHGFTPVSMDTLRRLMSVKTFVPVDCHDELPARSR
jgi:calcineurin-like phosphoesterase family protein